MLPFDHYILVELATNFVARVVVWFYVPGNEISSSSSEPEVQVIGYQTQQFKLLPLLATAYTFSFTSVYMIQMFLEIQMNIAKDNLMSLSEVCMKLVIMQLVLVVSRACNFTLDMQSPSCFSTMPLVLD